MFDIAIVLASVIVSAVAVLYPALGEAFSELSGVYNIGLEGIMLICAALSFLGVRYFQSLWLGIVIGVGGGVLIGLIQALFAVRIRADQIVFGLGIIIMGQFLSSFLSGLAIQQTGRFGVETLPVLGTQNLPYPLNVILRQNALVYFSLALVLALWVLLFKTKFGLAVKSVGEDPYVAASAGVKVELIRYVSVIAGCAIASLGGIFVILGLTGTWSDGITGGNGFIAIAMVRVGHFRPLPILATCLLYGGVVSLQLELQVIASGFPHQFLQMIPYMVGILALLVSGRTSFRAEPGSLGKPYVREKK
jgi:simple sugar transport system permease protein